ncbi:MAG TPA: cyclic nucleotide-binding domain-containing protein [Actinomycetota bacterium]
MTRSAERALAEVPLFEGLTRDQIRSLLDATVEVTCDAGQSMVDEGMLAIDFYLILDGEAEVVSGGRHVASLGPGDHFGELAVIDGEPRSATVQATTRLRALRLVADDFHRLLRTTPELAHRILVEAVRRLRSSPPPPTA